MIFLKGELKFSIHVQSPLTPLKNCDKCSIFEGKFILRYSQSLDFQFSFTKKYWAHRHKT